MVFNIYIESGGIYIMLETEGASLLHAKNFNMDEIEQRKAGGNIFYATNKY